MKRAIFAALAFMLCYPLAAQQQELYVPQVIAGRDPASGLFLQTTFYLWNLSSEELEVQIDLVTNDGQPMQAFLFKTTLPPTTEFKSSGSLTLAADGAAMPATTTDWSRPPEDVPFLVGWAKVTASAPVQMIVTVASIRIFQGASQIVTSTSVTPDPLMARFSTLGLVIDDVVTVRTGLAILNPSLTDPCEVRIESFSSLGLDKREVVFTLPPKGKVVEFLDEEAFFPGVPYLWGKILVTASRPVSAIAIRVDGLNWSGFRLAAGSN